MTPSCIRRRDACHDLRGYGPWFAYLVPSDPDHASAVQWMLANREPLFTTDYVVDETITLLAARGEKGRALDFGRQVFDEKRIPVYPLREDDLLDAWMTFRDFRDKDWSFTDCTSKVVIEKLAIPKAFSFDHHFRQFGAVEVVP